MASDKKDTKTQLWRKYEVGILEKLLSSPTEALVGFFVVLFCIKEGIELYKWFKSRGKEMYDKDAEIEVMKSKISAVEKRQEEQTCSFITMQQTLMNINTTLINLETERKKDTVAQGRASLYDLYNKLKDKDELTLGEHEVVSDVFARYENAGGNGTFKKLSKKLLEKPLADE